MDKCNIIVQRRLDLWTALLLILLVAFISALFFDGGVCFAGTEPSARLASGTGAGSGEGTGVGARSAVVGSANEAELALGDFLDLALHSSPQVKEQKKLLELSEGDEIRRFVFNEPTLQYTTTDNRTADAWGVTLPVPFPLKPFAMSRLDRSKTNAQRLELQARTFDTAKLVAQTYIDCAQAQQVDHLNLETLEDLTMMSNTLRRLYEEGHSTQAEKIGAELQVHQARMDQQTASEKTQVACSKLKRLILSFEGESAGEDEEATLFRAGTEGSDQSSGHSSNQRSDQRSDQRSNESSAASGLRNASPRLQLEDDLSPSILSLLGGDSSDQARAQATRENALATQGTAAWTQVPDFTLSVTHNHYLYLPGSPNGQINTWNYGVSVTLPLLFPLEERVEVQRIKSQARMDANTAALLRISPDADREDAALEYRRSHRRLLELRRNDLNLAEALVDSTYSAYRAGKLGYAELVLSRKTLADLRTQDIQLRSSILMSHLRCLDRCGETLSPVPQKAASSQTLKTGVSK